MRNQTAIIKEVRMLCHKMFEDALDENQIAQLDALVTSNSSARMVYIELVNIHDMLMRYSASAVLRDDKQEGVEELGIEEVGSFIEDPDHCDPLLAPWRDELSSMQDATRKSIEAEFEPVLNDTIAKIITQALPTAVKNILSSSSFFAGTVTFSVGMFLLMIFMLVSSNVQPPSYFARVSQAVEAVWVNDTGEGDLEQLCIGRRLELESGLIQVEYENGVCVNLEGPSVFVVSGPNRGILLRGKASVLVKDVPTGFAIQTPIGKIIDLGTEFGVVVTENQDTEVQVFDGMVKLNVFGGKQKGGGVAMPAQSLELREREAVQIDSQVRIVEPVPYLPDQFARTYKNLRRYYFDDFSTDTSDKYVGAYSIWDEKEGDHGVVRGSMVAEVRSCTYSIFSRRMLLGTDEVFAVTVPASRPGLDIFVVASTAIGEPQGGTDGGIGFRLRREFGHGLVIQQIDSTRGSSDHGDPLVVDASRVKDPTPNQPLRLIVERTGETEFTFYYELSGVRTKIYGPISSPELASVERLYVGVEVSSRNDRKQSVAFDNLSVRPVSK